VVHAEDTDLGAQARLRASQRLDVGLHTAGRWRVKLSQVADPQGRRQEAIQGSRNVVCSHEMRGPHGTFAAPWHAPIDTYMAVTPSYHVAAGTASSAPAG
jgi:hypothetical protein